MPNLHEAAYFSDIETIRKLLAQKHNPNTLYQDANSDSQFVKRFKFHKNWNKFSGVFDKIPVYLGALIAISSLFDRPKKSAETLAVAFGFTALGSFPYYVGNIQARYSDLLPDEETMKHWPPLFFAALSGNVEIAKLLIKAGADVAYEYKGENFLTLAKKLGDNVNNTEFYDTMSRYLLLNQSQVSYARIQTATNLHKGPKSKFMDMLPQLTIYKSNYKAAKKHLWVYFDCIEKCREFSKVFNAIVDGNCAITAKASKTKRGFTIVRFDNVTTANLASLAAYEDQLKKIPLLDKQIFEFKVREHKGNEVNSSPFSMAKAIGLASSILPLPASLKPTSTTDETSVTAISPTAPPS